MCNIECFILCELWAILIKTVTRKNDHMDRDIGKCTTTGPNIEDKL